MVSRKWILSIVFVWRPLTPAVVPEVRSFEELDGLIVRDFKDLYHRDDIAAMLRRWESMSVGRNGEGIEWGQAVDYLVSVRDELKQKHVSIAVDLLRRGAGLNKKDANGHQSCPHLLVSAKTNEHLFSLLLRNGAAINYDEISSISPALICLERRLGTTHNNLKRWGFYCRHAKFVPWMLKEIDKEARHRIKGRKKVLKILSGAVQNDPAGILAQFYIPKDPQELIKIIGVREPEQEKSSRCVIS